ARKKLSQVASALLDMKIPEDALFMATSGRYEYKNKGLDLYVDALGQLNSAEGLNRTIIAFILVPANNYGPRKALMNKLASCKSEDEFDNRILTHNLHDADLDPILTRMKKWNLDNTADKKVKVIFVPSYLNGNDGIFNMKYYDLLIGMDVTVFASYYEPWGYTPLESLAFHVPTITTTLAGFGKWVNAQLEGNKEAVEVIERGDGNDQDVVQKIVDKIVSCSSKNLEEKAGIKKDAYEISRIALWKNLIEQYHKAYAIALEKVELRRDTFTELQQTEIVPRVHQSATEKPTWKRVIVHSIIPERFSGLKEMANNIWWSWNFKASELFKSIDKKSWREKHYNPLALLEDVTTDRYLELEKDKDFVQRYDEVYREFLQYMLEKDKQSGPVIAYFSMEFGFNDNLKIFSGGLGILAGDYMKQASDSNVNMVGVGLLYRHGYFNQTLSISGEQQAAYLPQKFGQLPLSPARDNNGEWLLVSIAFPGRTLYARIWEVNVGRNTLYLLDTDFDDNHEMDRTVTHQLYGGDHENRFRQEMLLGIGGIRTLNALGLRPDVYHCNEGHAAFIGLERLRVLRTKRNMTFHEALEIIRASTLFTTHTPVPAGHDTFDEDLIRTYMAHYPSRLKITWEDMMGLGKIDQASKKFSMSYLAANLSQEINGVSWLHGEVTKKMFSPLWNGYFPEESHIGYVTNGVHLQTWTAKAWKMLYEDVFGKDFTQHLNDRAMWTKIYDVPDERIWAVRQRQRKKLVDYVKERVRQNWIRSYENPKNIVEVVSNINENTLTIGFARRFATYKRAHLLLKNLDRLSELLNNEKAPVQLLFAGKAHPNDKAGQDLIKYIVEVSKRPEFLGKIVFLENYDIELARKLVQGVDIWLNTPTRPLEASGTSGMKAVMNGALHFSVLDGWWVEGYKEGAGWALPEERTYDNQSFQDDLDAETIYTMLENEVIPLFYDRNEKGIPEAWIKFVKNSIALVAPEFTTQRMLDDYVERFYNKLYDRSQVIRKGDYQMAIEIANWKKQVARKWESLEVESVAIPDYEKHPVKMSDKYHGELVINLGEMNVEEVGVDLVVASSIATDNVKIFSKYDVELKKIMGKRAFYYLERNPVKPGNFSYAIRIYAKNK
ncbi:MAG: alpha-glucan family phosphorylase, partial [Bacteroidota bacterium]